MSITQEVPVGYKRVAYGPENNGRALPEDLTGAFEFLEYRRYEITTTVRGGVLSLPAGSEGELEIASPTYRAWVNPDHITRLTRLEETTTPPAGWYRCVEPGCTCGVSYFSEKEDLDRLGNEWEFVSTKRPFEPGYYHDIRDLPHTHPALYWFTEEPLNTAWVRSTTQPPPF